MLEDTNFVKVKSSPGKFGTVLGIKINIKFYVRFALEGETIKLIAERKLPSLENVMRGLMMAFCGFQNVPKFRISCQFP